MEAVTSLNTRHTPGPQPQGRSLQRSVKVCIRGGHHTDESRHLSDDLGASLVPQLVKNLPAVQETQVRSPNGEDPLEKEMATHFSILAWKIPWTEERCVNQPQTIPQVWNASSFCNIFFKQFQMKCFLKSHNNPQRKYKLLCKS